MNFSLDISNEKRQTFLDYFRANLRSKQAAFSGEARYLQDGSFVTSVNGPFPINDHERIHLKWTLHITPSGTLTEIAITCLDPLKNEEIWRESAQSFIYSVLNATINEKRHKYFRRNLFCYVGPPLDGEYWLPGPPKFRFSPFDPSDKELVLGLERIVCIDMEVEAIDETDASHLADEKSRRYAARLSLFLDHDLYNPSRIPIENVWVVPYDHGKPPPEESRRYQRALFFKAPPPVTSMPKKGQLCELGEFSGPLWEGSFIPGSLKLPSNTREILKNIVAAGPQFEDAFDRCARLYQVSQANKNRFPSVSLAYEIAALEALAVKTEGYKDFRDFINQSFDKESIKIIDSIYGNVRSAHFHGGSFPMGEFDFVYLGDPLLDSGILEQHELGRKVGHVTKNIIVSILKKIVALHGPQEGTSSLKMAKSKGNGGSRKTRNS